MNRRRALHLFAGAALLGTSGLAAAAEPIHVVKFVNFSCAACRTSESMDAPIRSAVEQGGGRFVPAPLPRGRNDYRERFYYVLRDLGQQSEVQVRASLYKGAQDLNYPLADTAQTMNWLQTDLPNARELDWAKLVGKVNNDASVVPVDRAVTLAIRAGLQVVPCYILLQGDQILATLDPQSVAGSSLPALRDAVLAALRKAQSANP